MGIRSNFIHLHVHSEYSILDGSVKIAGLLESASQQGMPAVALTDHGNIFGAINFTQQARKKGIKPILGCECYVAPRGRKHKKPGSKGQNHFHLVLLVKNEVGYKNLCQLITKSYLEGFYYKPRIDKELLSQHSEGLVALSACLKGEVSDCLNLGYEDKAEEAAREYMSIFSEGDFYIEVQDHGLEEQKKINPLLIKLARKLDLPLVATNDVHYLNKDDAESHDVLLCIQTNKKVTDEDRIRFGTQEFYFKSADEMMKLFKDCPDAIENTVKIAAKCNFELSSSGYHLPHFDPPQGFSLNEFFEKTARDGFRERMKSLHSRIEKGELSGSEEYERRLEKEIQLVEEMGFEGYFLVVWDLIREAKLKNIPVGPGRGSAAGSLLAFSLGITEIDPLEYDLLFERFLNPERISLPDIDIDFCGRRRDEIISYVTSKYGRENVCQIITFGTMAARQAVRDVGRALDVPLSQVDKIAKMIPSIGEDSSIAAASKKIPQLKALRKKEAFVERLLSVAEKLEGHVRHPSIHAAGVVITPKPLVEFVPLYKSAKDEITTQFPMQDIESIGLLKMDILGLRNLTVIQDTIDLVAEANGEKIDLNDIPLDDEKTFQVFQAGNTDGVFQFESSGMKDLLRRVKPTNFRDLIALNALYRPGPLQSGMTEDFIKCKNNPALIDYEFPELQPILKETKGLIVYQEQVMRIATDIAGFSMAEADLLRTAMGKKKTSVMKAQKKRFVQGAKERGISQSNANKIFDQINYFAGYGFNKSHSAAYAHLAYQTAYLKAHHPVYFMAALLTSEADRGTTSQVVKYINECKDMGINVLPPDINKSNVNFCVKDGDICFGLAAVKNIGEGAVRKILEAREREGEFSSPFDICKQVGPRVFNRKVIENLIKSGAFDSMGWKRSQLYQLVDDLIKYTHDFDEMKSSNQTLLFGSSQMEPPPIPEEIKAMEEWERLKYLAYEKEALGFYITGHPLQQYKKRLRGLVTHSISQLHENLNSHTEIRLAGIIASVKPLKTRKGDRMATFVLEDMDSRIEIVAFPESYGKYYEFIQKELLVWVKALVQSNGGSIRVQLSQIMPLEDAFQKMAKKLILRVNLPALERSVFDEIKALLMEFEGECPVLLELETKDALKVLLQSVDIQGVKCAREMTERLEDLLGDNAVLIKY